MNIVLDVNVHQMHIQHMKLDAYLTEKQIGDQAFAEMVGLSRSMVTRLRNGSARPSAESALRIEVATDHQVTLADLMSGETGEARPTPAEEAA